MGSIPLPALHTDPIAQPPNMLQMYGQMMGIKNAQQEMAQRQAMAPLQQQQAQQQVQSGQLENQKAQQDLAARQALTQAYQGSMSTDSTGKPSFDPDKLQQGLMSGPAAYQTPAVMKSITDTLASQTELQQKKLALQQTGQELTANAAVAVKAANYDPIIAHSLLDHIAGDNPQNPQVAQIRQVIDNPQALKQWVDTRIASSPEQQKLQNAKDVAAIRANTPEAQEMSSWMMAHKHPDGTPATPAEYQQFKVDQGVAAAVAKETNPAVVRIKEQISASEAQAHQAMQDGDPKSAAQLLINGDIAPSQIISSRKPAFAQQAFQAAHDLSGGQWNAQQADAQFNVAKSPGNVQFFGAAKSLTDPGGTLDQLKAAGKDIPQGQLPAFNTLADWEKAQTGSGPIAKYAAIALGASDDAAKVMGGGVATDTARLQFLNNIAAKLSPEQRAGAIEGTRGAVNSQINSRIGANPIMRRMYGGNQQPGGGTGAPQNNGQPGTTQGGSDPFAQFGGKAH